MNARVAFPFLTLQPTSVLVSGWMVSMGEGEPVEAGEWLSDWDASTPLRLTRTVGIDVEAAARDLEIDPDRLELAAALRIGTGPGRMPRAIIARERKLLSAAEPVILFEIDLDGGELSTLLDLHVDLVLPRDCADGSDLSPRRAGERVWHDALRIRIEGEEPRLPIEVADLAALLPGTAGDAPWYVDWSPRDWTRDFHGAIRLYLNGANRDVVARIEAEDPEILRALMADLMGQVCEALVRDDAATEIIESCSDGSLGAQAHAWLAIAFPRRDLTYARSILEQRPGVFRASIQALAQQQVADE